MSNGHKKISITETLFEKIYRLAKEKDEKALTKIVEEGSCLGVTQSEYNPIKLLAKEGHVEAVDFLIAKFKENLNYAVQGYAAGGYVDKVENLLSRGACLNHAVQGYARGGYADKVENLLSRGASINDAVWGYAVGGYADKVENLISRGASINHAVRGYALGGHADKVESLLLLGASINGAVRGYAAGGHADKVENLLSRGASINDAVWAYAAGGYADKVENLLSRGASLDYAVWGYARGGHADKVENLISHGASMNEAIRGYAAGGHSDKVENLLSRGASLNHATQSYALARHVDKVENLISRGASINEAVRGYAFGGHVDQVENLISRGASINEVAAGYTAGGYFANHKMVLKILAFTKNVEIRKQLAEAAKKENASLFPQDLLREEAKLRQLINEYQLDFNQAIFFMKPWMMPELHTWFLQGIQLVKEKRLPFDIFITISSFISGLSHKDTQNLFNIHREVMPKKLFDVSFKSAKKQFNKCNASLNFNFFSNKKMLEEESLKKLEKTIHEATSRYQKRLIF